MTNNFSSGGLKQTYLLMYFLIATYLYVAFTSDYGLFNIWSKMVAQNGLVDF